MRALLPLLLCGAAFAQERAFVEVTAPKKRYYVGERVPLTLRLGYDREFFRTNAVPLLPRRMDVLLQVRAKIPGGPAEERPPRGPTFALNEDIVEAEPLADETRSGRPFAVLAWRRVFTPAEPGDLVVPAPALRYVHATVFEEDFVAGRIARDPQDALVTGEPLTLRVLPLPDEGRPEGFHGAVGRFTIEARCDRASVEAGEIFDLTVTIRGEGNAPPLRIAIPGFHVYGTVHKEGGSTAVLDVAALSADVKEIPVIPFAFFDPESGYRVVRTEPIPLEVRPREAAPQPPSPSAAEDATGTIVAIIAVVLAGAAALALWLQRRSREAPPDPRTVRLREAFEALRARPSADALAEFLATYLGCAPAAVIGPDLAARLAAKGLPKDLAARVAATLERLVAARYGAGGGADDLGPLLADIEATLPPPR